MATRTKNYELTRPEGTDPVDVDVLNDNFDIIDTQLKINADRTAGKQDKLIFDDTAVAGSNNPVRSKGIYTALQEKQDKMTFDDAPVSGSNNPVRSKGIFTALQGKQDELAFDDTPASGSNNPVRSKGIFSALEGKQDALTFDTSPT